jgi:hypothetical protein
MMTNTEKAIEMMICTNFQHEGIGSLYERVVLSRFLRDLAMRYGYASVLEFSCPITKGYDNITFLDQGVQVTLADEDIGRIEGGWKFAQQPAFTGLRSAPTADLVWNFAQIQMNEKLIDLMKPLSTKHVLVFVPNFLNIGTPAHLTYHLLTRTACRHAERGSIRIRTKGGLLRFLAEQNIEVIESGYIDAPPLPDIGFSIRELKETIGWSKPDKPNGDSKANGNPTTDPGTVWQRVQHMMRFENSALVAPFKPVFGHHIFALGRIG